MIIKFLVIIGQFQYYHPSLKFLKKLRISNSIHIDLSLTHDNPWMTFDPSLTFEVYCVQVTEFLWLNIYGFVLCMWRLSTLSNPCVILDPDNALRPEIREFCDQHGTHTAFLHILTYCWPRMTPLWHLTPAKQIDWLTRDDLCMTLDPGYAFRSRDSFEQHLVAKGRVYAV